MNDIVKYDNDLNLTQHFNKLNQMEQDIFFCRNIRVYQKK